MQVSSNINDDLLRATAILQHKHFALFVELTPEGLFHIRIDGKLHRDFEGHCNDKGNHIVDVRTYRQETYKHKI